MSERAVIDVVMVTNDKRRILTRQAIESLMDNSTKLHAINVVVVHDNTRGTGEEEYGDVEIFIGDSVGASRCRNIGASSVPKYRRGQYVMFCDDDVYMCPGWDERLIKAHLRGIISGHAHPYNHTVLTDFGYAYSTTVLSTVHMFMEWDVWDQIGFFVEPGGPGGSEDVNYCQRATQLHFSLNVTKPHCVIHTGMTNSRGERIVGYIHVAERNNTIESQYGLQGKVIYS